MRNWSFVVPVLAVCSCAAPQSTQVLPPARASMAEAVPLKVEYMFQVVNQVFAGVPSVDRGTFAGRCSVPSDWVVTASATGKATHLGRITGTASHCSQVEWQLVNGSPVPIHMTYSDGQADFVAANGDVLRVTYGEGTSTFGPTGGTFHDHFIVAGGTGRFAQATGAGVDDGTFTAMDAPMPTVMVGTIRYR